MWMYAAANVCAAMPALKLVFSCAADNDLYRVMTADGTRYPRYDNATEAVRTAEIGTGVLVLADGYPDKWRWTNGIQQERVRMLLALAWLVRVEDTPEHRGRLHRIAKDLLAHQAASGAIPERLGDLDMGRFRPPQSNKSYGCGEASLIQENGDPVVDLLYTCNFALIALHEAAAATDDPELTRAADRLADFIVRIQVSSKAHPEFDGVWYRAFDFKRWEYWASNSDVGWGSWCTETGWTQGWIVATLALRRMNKSLWDLTAESKIADHFDKYQKMMLPKAPQK